MRTAMQPHSFGLPARRRGLPSSTRRSARARVSSGQPGYADGSKHEPRRGGQWRRIDGFYNCVRRHSCCDMRSPVHVELNAAPRPIVEPAPSSSLSITQRSRRQDSRRTPRTGVGALVATDRLHAPSALHPMRDHVRRARSRQNEPRRVADRGSGVYDVVLILDGTRHAATAAGPMTRSSATSRPSP
jgi:hypothetical protein